MPVASAAEIRARLSRNYQEPAALTAYLVEEVQREIAAHNVSIPNDPEGLAAHTEKKNFLTEQLVALQLIHEIIPEGRETPKSPSRRRKPCGTGCSTSDRRSIA